MSRGATSPGEVEMGSDDEAIDAATNPLRQVGERLPWIPNSILAVYP